MKAKSKKKTVLWCCIFFILLMLLNDLRQLRSALVAEFLSFRKSYSAFRTKHGMIPPLVKWKMESGKEAVDQSRMNFSLG